MKAAAKLAGTAGISRFSMRDLAKEAGVSLATPFNLFGSKSEIIFQIFDGDLASFRSALLSRHGLDDVESFFAMARLAQLYYRQKGALYRSLYADFQLCGTDLVFQRFTEPRLRLFAEVASASQRAGSLDPTLSSELIASSCNALWDAVTRRWVYGAISLSRMHREICFGTAALMVGFATPEARPRLLRQMHHFHAAMRGKATSGQ